MKYILLVLFTAFSISLNAQMSPPTVTRSGNSLTQQDSYLTVAKRLGIPTSATDDLDAAVTAQNSIKLLYNTTLNQLRVYNPLTLTWSGIGGSILASNGNYVDNDSVKLGGALTENTIIERNNNDFIILYFLNFSSCSFSPHNSVFRIRIFRPCFFPASIASTLFLYVSSKINFLAFTL